MAEKLTLILEDLAGGLNTQKHSSKIEDNQTPDCQNVFPENAPSIKKRKGFSKVGGDVGSAALRISGMYNYVKSDGVEYLVCVQGTTLYYLNSAGAWTTTSFTGFTTGNECTFTVYEDALYIANGVQKIVKATHNSAASPTAPSWTVAAISDAQCPKVELVTVHKHRLIGTRDVDTANQKSRTFYSNWSDATAWEAADYDDIMPDDGDEIVGQEPLHDSLYYFKTNAIYSQEGDLASDAGAAMGSAARLPIRKTIANVGASSDRSICYYQNNLIFFGKKGVFSFDGSRENLLSNNIQKTLQDDVDTKNLSQAAAVVFKDRYYLSLPSSATKTISTATRTTNVVTVTTSTAHGYATGERVHIDGVSVGATDFNGRFPIASVPSTTTLTYAQTAANDATGTGGTSNIYDNSLLYVYDFKTSSWWKYTGHNINCFAIKDSKLYGGDSRNVASAGNVYQLDTGTSDPTLVAKVIDDCETTWTGAADNIIEFRENVTSQKITSTDQAFDPTATTSPMDDVDKANTFRPRGRNIVEDSNGDIIVAYADTSDNTKIQVHRYNAGGTLDTDLGSPQVTAHDSYDQYYPEVRLLSNDDIVCIWCGQDDATNEEVFISTYTSSAWTTPVSLKSEVASIAFNWSASLVVSDENSDDLTFYVACGFWISVIVAGIVQVYKTTDGGATWALSKQYVSSSVSPYAVHPQIITDNNNYIHVTWEGYNGSSKTLSYARYTTSWQASQDFVQNPADFSIAVQADNSINIVFIGNDSKTYWFTSGNSGANWGNATEFNVGSGKSWKRIGLAFGSAKTDDGYARNDWQIVATANDDKIYRCNHNHYNGKWAGWEQIGTTAADSFDFGMKWSYHNNNNPRSTLCIFDDGVSDQAKIRRIGNLTSATNANKDSLTLDLTAFTGGATSTTSDPIHFWLYVPKYANFQVLRLTIKEDDTNYAYIEKTAADIISTDATWTEFWVAKSDFTEVNDGSAMDWSAITELDFWTLSYGLACSTSMDDLKLVGDAEAAIQAHWKTKSFGFGEPDKAKRMKKAFVTATKQTTQVNIEALYELDQKKVLQPTFLDITAITAATTTTVTNSSGGWTVDDYKDMYLRFTSDTATAALRDVELQVASNTATVITLAGVLDNTPATTDKFYVYDKQLINTYKDDARLLVNKRLNLSGNCKLFDVKFQNYNAGEDFELHDLALHYKLKKAKELE